MLDKVTQTSGYNTLLELMALSRKQNNEPLKIKMLSPVFLCLESLSADAQSAITGQVRDSEGAVIAKAN